MQDYSSYGPAYRGLKVKDGVYVPKPVADFSGDNPFTRMAPIRGTKKDIVFDGSYPYIDRSPKARFMHFLTYAVAWLLAFPVNRFRYGIRIEGRGKLWKNRKLLREGAMTVCNHVCRWDMICVLQAVRFRQMAIPMYSEPFKGADGWIMKAVGGVPIPDDRSGLRAFDAAFDEMRSRKRWIHIFPESCSWKYYSPLRPFKTGAFHMAYKYGIPVVPTVISFRPRIGIFKLFGKDDEPLMTIHVGDPIVADTTVPRKTECARIRDAAHASMLDMAGIIENPWPSAID